MGPGEKLLLNILLCSEGKTEAHRCHKTSPKTTRLSGHQTVTGSKGRKESSSGVKQGKAERTVKLFLQTPRKGTKRNIWGLQKTIQCLFKELINVWGGKIRSAGLVLLFTEDKIGQSQFFLSV